MRKREMRGYGGNHHKKLGHKRISCAKQLTIPDPAGTTPDPAGTTPDPAGTTPDPAGTPPDPACKNTDTRSSKPN